MISEIVDDYFAISSASRFVRPIYDRHLASAGLTIGQYSMLARLQMQDDVTMARIAESMQMDRTSALRSLLLLQRDGFACSTAPRGRTLTFHLTEAGATWLSSARNLWATAQAEFESRYGADKAGALRQKLLCLTGLKPGSDKASFQSGRRILRCRCVRYQHAPLAISP